MTAARKEKLQRFREMIRTLAALPPEKRAELSSRMGSIVTCDGHVLSLRNSCLIGFQTQRPVTMVGGFSQWQRHGRAVNKDEHGLMILFPSQKKQAEGSESEAELFFLMGYVYDVTQTHEMTVEELQRRRADADRKEVEL